MAISLSLQLGLPLTFVLSTIPLLLVRMKSSTAALFFCPLYHLEKEIMNILQEPLRMLMSCCVFPLVDFMSTRACECETAVTCM